MCRAANWIKFLSSLKRGTTFILRFDVDGIEKKDVWHGPCHTCETKRAKCLSFTGCGGRFHVKCRPFLLERLVSSRTHLHVTDNAQESLVNPDAWLSHLHISRAHEKCSLVYSIEIPRKLPELRCGSSKIYKERTSLE